MNNLEYALDGAWKVLAAGLVLGAGLPAVFAVGIRSLAWGTGGTAEIDASAKPHSFGRVLATLCFAIVLAGIALGITIVVASGFGKTVSFEHVYPTLIDKK
jgi:succinate dehydrogenase/fumarate reductase cytochrome b subunit